MRRLSYRYQRTLACPAEVEGIGFLTGASVCLRFVPAPPDTGIIFVRTDFCPPVEIPADIDQVTGTQRRTTLAARLRRWNWSSTSWRPWPDSASTIASSS